MLFAVVLLPDAVTTLLTKKGRFRLNWSSLPARSNIMKNRPKPVRRMVWGVS